MRVLGVDPGLTRCGVGVVDGTAAGLQLVDVSVVRTPSEQDLALRLVTVADHVEAALDRFRPDRVAIERMFTQQNLGTVMGTAHAAGVVALAAARRGIPVAWHTPSEVKAAVSGNGSADKAQVTAMVTRLLRLAVAPRPADAADALALAICHLWRSPLQARIRAHTAVTSPGSHALTELQQAARLRARRTQARLDEARRDQIRQTAARRAALGGGAPEQPRWSS
ncbi:crossover junction endodeoxyribonuclease RuvC [Nakamurella flavida]|uniref:Crossover junction endodeoxyribonuclease RuvC n=1 Tax=Nakamurella flavida TaxID=363630 RepID=A0A939C3U4_9ACTN|nr:crossover junction endodeoxyribonuclease RuvC [Nakamurella flavida]MBM9477406.1 crossover junction endodeoxyribonuclease RuvC [Nakamurella flavida]MDP9777339.1 crossover junction endodeoxyribonuclease RuvC [Nakamurella flavida]